MLIDYLKQLISSKILFSVHNWSPLIATLKLETLQKAAGPYGH